MSRFTDGGQVVEAESVERCLRRQRIIDGSAWHGRDYLAHERISRLGLSTGPGEREGCSALATLDNSPGLVLSDGSAELEALKDAVDGPCLPGVYKSELKPKRARKSRSK